MIFFTFLNPLKVVICHTKEALSAYGGIVVTTSYRFIFLAAGKLNYVTKWLQRLWASFSISKYHQNVMFLECELKFGHSSSFHQRICKIEYFVVIFTLLWRQMKGCRYILHDLWQIEIPNRLLQFVKYITQLSHSHGRQISSYCVKSCKSAVISQDRTTLGTLDKYILRENVSLSFSF